MSETTFNFRQQAGRTYSGSKLPTVHGWLFPKTA